ncbi:MAG TPA: hypothetical protein VEY94_08345 [Patescibacteria group bacterium]|nr:hypothetical protein [Patescibacteria group bacterium]
MPTQIADPLNSTSPIDAGYREMYNLDFSGAHVAFQQWERSHPEDPLGPTSEAAADLFWEFNQMHVLESDLFMDDDKFFYRRAAPDPQVKLRFEQEVARAENLATQRLERTPHDRNALLAKVFDAGMEADYAALIENRYFASLAEMKQSGRLAQTLLTYSPSCYDAYLAIGVENYVLSLNPAPVRWLLDLYGAETNRQTGIERLELTAARGHYLEPFARVLLAVAALRANDRQHARELLQGLVQEFPKNQLYARELARLQ